MARDRPRGVRFSGMTRGMHPPGAIASVYILYYSQAGWESKRSMTLTPRN